MSRNSQLQLLLLVMIFGFLAGPRVMAALQAEVLNKPASPDGALVAAVDALQPETPSLATTSDTSSIARSLYDTLDLQAKSVYVWDIKTHEVLYAKAEREQLPLASVAKMMMALVAVESLSERNEVVITPDDLREDGDHGLFAGERWTLRDLLDFTLVTSSNDGASAIASVAGASLLRSATSTDHFAAKKRFIEQMNAKAHAIGLEDTYFLNESGLDIDSVTSGAYGTSRDMAMLFEYIFRKHPNLFTPTTYAKIDVRSNDNIVHHVSNTNEGVAVVTGMIGSKTGYTDLAGGNLVVVVDIGVDHPVVIAVLGSTKSGRFSDVSALIDATVHEITH